MVADIEAEAAAHREETGLQPMGPAAVLAQDPHSRPQKIKKSPAPRFHTATKAARCLLNDAYRELVSAYRQAAEKLRKGDRTAVFPPGRFPPALPFVGG